MRITALLVCAAAWLYADAASPVGVWRGESLCATSAASCHDEKVVYYIEADANDPAIVLIRADKIVDGKAVTMGSGPWKYDREHATLSMESQGRVWLLRIAGNHIEGTLTMPDKVVFRRMTLGRESEK